MIVLLGGYPLGPPGYCWPLQRLTSKSYVKPRRAPGGATQRDRPWALEGAEPPAQGR